MNKINKTMVVATAVAISLIATWNVYAQSEYQEPTCVVKSEYDSLDDTGINTLRKTIARLNAPKTSPLYSCFESITFAGGITTVQLKHTLKIKPEYIADRLTIGNDDPLNQVVIDASSVMLTDGTKMSNLSEEEKKKFCAIRIVGNNITVRNIKIVGSPVGGICIEGTGVILDNVDVIESYRSGIVLGPTAVDTVITPSSSIEHVKTTDATAFGVLMFNADSISGNRIEGTNRLVTEETDINGLAVFAPLEEGIVQEDFQVRLMSGERVFSSPVDSKIVLVAVNEIGEKVYDVWGGVSKSEAPIVVINDGVSPNDACNPINFSQFVTRIQVYGVGVDPVDNQLKSKFLTYITDSTLSKETAPENIRGLFGSSQGMVSGTFRIRIDTTAEGSIFKGFNQFMLIPEYKDYTMGRSSQIITLGSYNVKDTYDLECNNVNIGQGVGVNPVPGGSSSISFQQWLTRRYIDPNDCAVKNPSHMAHTQYYDSDKDGIEDRFEDNGDCVYDPATDTSDMWNADTDYDGISDIKEPSGTCGAKCKDLNKKCIQEADCDGGSVNDGMEDRNNRIFRSDRKAYLFRYGSAFGAIYSDGEMVECPLTTGTESQNGVTYKIYKIIPAVKENGKTITPPHAIIYNNEAITNETVDIFECRNATLAAPTNFNGKKDVTWETDIKDWNDDELSKTCEGKGGKTDTASGKCVYTCISGSGYEVLLQINDLNFVAMDPMGMPSGLADKKKLENGVLVDGSDGIYDIEQISWQQVAGICGDMDGDKIPDCIENPKAQCYEELIGSQGTYLNPYSNDSEGDGDGDYNDSDPFNADKTGDMNTFLNRPILACFVDRDGDGLRDCEEKKVDGTTTLKTDGTESNPLDADSDDDGLGDLMEKTFVTNPMNSDTDKDKLSDCEETCGAEGLCNRKDNQGAAIPVTDKDSCTYLPASAGSQGCYVGETNADPSAATSLAMAFYGDTDATKIDTDGDNISDGDEVAKTHTNPNTKDSDVDGLNDDQEDHDKDGVYPHFENGVFVADETMDTNPCDANTDGVSPNDKEEIDKGTCPSNPKPCKYTANYGAYGEDTDGDNMPDTVEDDWGTDKNDPDTDNDGLVDGCNMNSDGTVGDLGELCWHVSTGNWEVEINTKEGESKPGKKATGDQTDCGNNGKDTVTLKGIYTDQGNDNFCSVAIGIDCGSDSDGDGLPDYYEKVMFKTLANSADSDGDGIADGIETKWVNANETALGSGLFVLVAQKGPEQYIVGSMTNPMEWDTDGDTLADGYKNSTNFEDKNCNGRVDLDANTNPLELDPTNANSDGDQWSDKDEFCWDGICGASANMSRATSANREGCGNIGGAGGETWGMTLLFAVMLAATRVAGAVLKRTKRSRRACSARIK